MYCICIWPVQFTCWLNTDSFDSLSNLEWDKIRCTISIKIFYTDTCKKTKQKNPRNVKKGGWGWLVIGRSTLWVHIPEQETDSWAAIAGCPDILISQVTCMHETCLIWFILVSTHFYRMQFTKQQKHRWLMLVFFFSFFQTEHKMSVEEVCRKFQTDIVQVSRGYWCLWDASELLWIMTLLPFVH